jgi:hypothetical protein
MPYPKPKWLPHKGKKLIDKSVMRRPLDPPPGASNAISKDSAKFHETILEVDTIGRYRKTTVGAD